MLTPLRIVLIVLFLLTGRSSFAEGMVQVSLSGQLKTPGGDTLVVQWSAVDRNGTVREVDFQPHLAERTSAHDLARLIAARLMAMGVEGVYPGDVVPASGITQIFVSKTTRIRLRLAPGLQATITTNESAPSLVRLLKPRSTPGAGKLSIRTSTRHPHTQVIRSVLLSETFETKSVPDTVCEALFIKGLEQGLVVDRPSTDSWRPIRGEGGAVVMGCSVVLDSPKADWGIEVQIQAQPR